MYARILVPVDGSETAQRGLAEAIRIARTSDAQIRLVHVVNELPLVAPEMSGTTLEHVIEHLKAGGRKILSDAQLVAREAGVPADTRMIEALGAAAGEHVVREASAWPADVIVCGTHGRRGIRRIVMGSDAEYIVRHSTVPVLLVRAARIAA